MYHWIQLTFSEEEVLDSYQQQRRVDIPDWKLREVKFDKAFIISATDERRLLKLLHFGNRSITEVNGTPSLTGDTR